MKGKQAIWSWITPALFVLTLLGAGQPWSSQAAEVSFILADWIVSDVQVVENQAISLEGNLVIKDGGSLTLRSVTLTLDGDYQGQYRIEVEPGGRLYIYDSIITAANPTAPFAFEVHGAAFEMHGSELHYAGWGADDENLDPVGLREGQLGLYLDLDGAILDGNTITQNHIGIIDAGDGTQITDNTIEDNRVHAIYTDDGVNGLISGNQIQHGGNASSLIRMRPGNQYTITQNSLFQEIHRGIIEVFRSEGNIIADNDISGNGVGIALMEHSNLNLLRNNTIDVDETGIMVYGRHNQVIDNHILAEDYIYFTGIYLVYAYNSIIDGNTIQGCGQENGIMVRHSSYNAIINNLISAREVLSEDRTSTGLILFNKSKNNIIQGNVFSDFQRGLGLFYDSDGNLISGNQFDSSPYQEAIIDESSNNRISGNNFLGTGADPYDDGDNQWDFAGEGNYWSAYSGADSNGDGIGDQPYLINPDGLDHAPLMEPVTISQVAMPTLDDAPEVELPDLVGLRVSGTMLIENQTLNLNWIEVVSGGNLTLRNVNIITGGDPRGLSSLQVQSGGRLVIEDSQLTHLEYGNGFIMLVRYGSSFVMRGSSIDSCGQEWWYGGIQIFTSDFLLENNTIAGTMLRFVAINGGQILGNTITHSYQSMVFDNSNTLIEGNIFTHSIHAVLVGQGSSNTFRGNQIMDIWENGLYLHGGSNNVFQDNTVSKIAPGYAGLHVTGNESRISSNTISQAGTCLFVNYGGDEATMTLENNHLSSCSTGLEIRSNTGSITNNEIVDCTQGIQLEGKYNLLRSNTIEGSALGMVIGYGYHNNQMYDNRFNNPGVQAQDYGHLNQWDNGARGNFWSDYQGPDADGNGIGDVPYDVLPNGVDRFPQIIPWPSKIVYTIYVYKLDGPQP